MNDPDKIPKTLSLWEKGQHIKLRDELIENWEINRYILKDGFHKGTILLKEVCKYNVSFPIMYTLELNTYAGFLSKIPHGKFTDYEIYPLSDELVQKINVILKPYYENYGYGSKKELEICR